MRRIHNDQEHLSQVLKAIHSHPGRDILGRPMSQQQINAEIRQMAEQGLRRHSSGPSDATEMRFTGELPPIERPFAEMAVLVLVVVAVHFVFRAVQAMGH